MSASTAMARAGLQVGAAAVAADTRCATACAAGAAVGVVGFEVDAATVAAGLTLRGVATCAGPAGLCA